MGSGCHVYESNHLRDELPLLLYIDFSLFANSKIQLRLTKWSALSCPLGGGRSIQLSYGDNYEFSLILRGFTRSGQGPGLYSEAISIRRMAFLLMDFRPLKAVFEKLFLFPMLEKRLNHDAIRTKAQIFKNHLARDILFLRRRPLYPTELRGLIQKIFNFTGLQDSNDSIFKRRVLYPAELLRHL